MTVAELDKIRTKSLKTLKLRSNKSGKKVIISMGECGLKAGARDILKTFIQEFNAKDIHDVSLMLNDCKGNCELEPVVYICDEKDNKIVYTNVSKSMVTDIISENILGVSRQNKVVAWKI